MMKANKRMSLLLILFLFVQLLPLQIGVAASDAVGVYHFSDLNLENGANIPVAGALSFGTLSGADGSVNYVKDPDGDYAELSAAASGPDMVPAIGFGLPADTTDSLFTAEFELRIADGTLENDKYFTFGFDNSSSAPGFDGLTIRNILNNNCQLAPLGDPFAFTQTPYSGPIQNGTWYSFKIAVNTKTHTYDMYVGGSLMYSKAYTGDFSRFLIGYGNWSSWHKPNPALTYDIRSLTVTLADAVTPTVTPTPSPEPDPDAHYDPGQYPDTTRDDWTAPTGATQTWNLKDQLAAGAYDSGEALAAYDAAQSGIFSAYFTDPADGTVKVVGTGTNQALKLSYQAGAKHRGSPAITLDLPETFNKGTVVADYKMLITPGTSWDWFETGLGSDALGDGNTFAEKVIYNGSHMLETPEGWRGVGGYAQGQWYRYVLTADLSLQTMTMDVYAPGDTAPSQHASYAMGAREIKRFVLKPIATSAAHEGTVLVKNAAVSYIPPAKTPALLSPEQGAFMVPLKPVFRWSSTGADSYKLELSKTADFSSEVTVISDLVQNSYTMETELDEFSTYYWRVTSMFTEDPIPYTSPVFDFTSDIRVPADNIYNAGSFGLIEGDWDTWPAHPGIEDVARNNAIILQALLDKAGRSGGGKIVLPSGIYCISGNPSIVGGNVLTIRYDNITLTGQGKDASGNYKTTLKTNYKWDGPHGVYRSTGICIAGEPFGSAAPRQNIEISHFELDGGYGWTGRSDWGYDPNVDYGWDINHKGIIVSQDKLVTHVTLDDLYVHKYSGETLYVGGKAVGYLEVKNCTLADTNASCFNLYAAVLNVHDNQFGTPDTKCRFWIEYCARASDISYAMPPIPEGLKMDHAYFNNNKFYNAVNAHGIAIAQGDCTTYTLDFENNLFDNSLSTPDHGLFQFAGAVYGPTIIKNNTIQNFPGSLIVFDYGGGTVPVDHLMNKNIYFENNHCTNVGGPFINLTGTWGIWDPVQNQAVPALQPVENLVVRNNYFEGSSLNSKSVAISNSWDMIESAVDLKSVEISGNIFKNCTTPEELRVFVGNLPLFRNNLYINTQNTEFGGISNISPSAPQIKPVFEHLTVNASTAVHAAMRTGKNEDTQQVVITGGANTAPILFDTAGVGFEIPVSRQVGPRDIIVFQYSTAKEKWVFKSYTPGTIQSLKRLVNSYAAGGELGGGIVKKLNDSLDKAQKEMDKSRPLMVALVLEKFTALLYNPGNKDVISTAVQSELAKDAQALIAIWGVNKIKQ